MASAALEPCRNSEPLISSQIIRCYVEFLERFHPEVDLEQLLAHAGIQHCQLNDRGDWLSQDQVRRFHQGLALSFDDCRLSQQVGRYLVSSRTAGIFRRYALGFLGPRMLYLHAPTLFARWTRALSFETAELADGRVELTTTLQPGCGEESCQCAYRTGVLEAMAEVFTGQLGQVEHPTCLHRGGDCCRYLVSWPRPEARRSRWSSWGLMLLSLVVAALLFSLFSFPGLAIAALASLCGGTLLAYIDRTRQLQLLQQALLRLSDDGEQTLEDIRICHNSAQLVLELGQAFASTLSEDQLWRDLLEAIRRRLDYPLGFVLRPAPDDAVLHFVQGSGLSAAQRRALEQAPLPLVLGQPLAWARCYRERRPVWAAASDAPQQAEALESLPAATLSYLPVVHEEQTLAVLVLATGNRQTSSERNLLHGVAAQAAVSLASSRAFQRLQEREAQYRFLAESVSDIIWTMDLQRLRLTYISPSVERLQGFTPAEVLQMPMERYLSPSSHALTLQRIAELAQQAPGEQQSTVLELELFRKDGSLLPGEVTVNILRDAAGRPILLTGVTRDISERKRAEQERTQLEAALWQAHKLEAIGTFAAGVAHDFSNILAVIMGYTEVVRLRLGAGSPLQDDLAKVLDAAHRGRALIRQVLSYGRPLQCSEILDLGATINTALPLVQALLPAEVALEVALQPDLGAVEGTTTQVQQVLVNLCANAAEACTAGGIVKVGLSNVEVDAALAAQHPDLSAGSFVRLTVSDDGRGIEPQLLTSIFDPFFTTRERGTGLGLALVKNIVSAMKGTVAVRSTLGQGTTFDVYLPRQARGQSRTWEEEAPAANEGGTKLSPPSPRPLDSGE